MSGFSTSYIATFAALKGVLGGDEARRVYLQHIRQGFGSSDGADGRGNIHRTA